MLQNAYFLAKIGADTAENEQHFAEILPKTGNYPTGQHQSTSTGSGQAARQAAQPAGQPWGSCQLLANFRQNVARFRLYRHRFLQENMRFAAFFKIYQILKLKFLKFDKILQILRHLQFFAEISRKLLFFQTDFLRKF